MSKKGKASATEPLKLIRLIETIKGNIKITLKELMELENIILQINDPTITLGPSNNTLKVFLKEFYLIKLIIFLNLSFALN